MLGFDDWDNLSAVEQWKLVLKNKKLCRVRVDSYETQVLVNFPEEDGQHLFIFRTAIGNEWGLHDLFHAVGIILEDM